MTDSEGLHGYTYDPTYEVTDLDYPVRDDQHYVYDPAGNRDTVTEGVDVTSYSVNDANRYMSVGDITYGYNHNGCLTREVTSTGTTYYQYDYENRLKTITYPDSTTSEYTYDYLGRRIKVNDNGTITKYIYDGNRVIAETNDTGNLICEYVYGVGIDEVLFMIRGSNFYYYHYDGLGSVRAITSSSESIVETYTYDVYGRPTIYNFLGQEIPESQFGNPYYFTGRKFDKTSGLYYYRNRYYNSELGRFMSPDPLGQLFEVNLYTYVYNNPVNWLDALGLFGGKMTRKAYEKLIREYEQRRMRELVKEGREWVRRGYEEAEEAIDAIPPGTPITGDPATDTLINAALLAKQALEMAVDAVSDALQ